MTQSGGEDMGPAENRKARTENPAPKPKALVLYGYGLNCDYETAYALERAGAEAEQVHVSDLISGAANLMNYHVLPVAGEFSWGDDHGAGVILALRLRLALGSALQEFIAGPLGYRHLQRLQVLVNLGLLPSLPGRAEARLATLIPSDCGNFRDAWVHLKAMDSTCVFTQGLDLLTLPIRHGEGKFYAAGPILAELANRGQIALKYATPAGNAAMGRFPHNPNGSLLDIAGICDATGRVLGLMPHPEAHISSFQHPTWTREKEAWRRRGEPYPEQVGAGLSIFRNAVRYLEESL